MLSLDMSNCKESEAESDTNYQIHCGYCHYYSPETEVNYGTYECINRSCIDHYGRAVIWISCYAKGA